MPLARRLVNGSYQDVGAERRDHRDSGKPEPSGPRVHFLGLLLFLLVPVFSSSLLRFK